MRHILSLTGKELANQKRQGRCLDKLCRRCLTLMVILCYLLAGCESPTKVANQSAINNEQIQMPRDRSFVDLPVAQTAISEVPKAHVGLGGPSITFDKMVHDYGQVSPRSKNVCEFRFKNTGTGTLTVDRKIGSTCGCAATTLAKTDYMPGEEGVIKVTYSASTLPITVKKYMIVHSNDKENPQVKLAITAKITPRVACEPKQLDLLLNNNSELCPPIKLKSLDGTPFSVTGILCTGNSITADFDPSVQATEFTIRPMLDIEKLQILPTGNLALMLTHPECKKVTIRYKALPKFQFVPALPMFFNVEPNIPFQKVVHLLSNYAEDFEIASFSSERNLVDVLEKTKLPPDGRGGARYHLKVSIKPPIRVGQKRFFTDTLLVHLTNGQTLKLNCRGIYAATQAAAAGPYPPP